MAIETQVAFKGTDVQRELAQAAFEVMRRKGVLFGANTPIRMSCEAIVAALTKPGGPMAGADVRKINAELEEALLLNDSVFGREKNGEFVTTKAGHAPGGSHADEAHTFRQRLNTDATNLGAEEAARYRASLVDLATTRDEKLFADEEEEEETPLVPTPRPIAHTPMPERRIIAVNIIPADEITPEMRAPWEPEVEELPVHVPAVPLTRDVEPAVAEEEGEEEPAVAAPAPVVEAPEAPAQVPTPATPVAPPVSVEAAPPTAVVGEAPVVPVVEPEPAAPPVQAAQPAAEAPEAAPTPAPVVARAPAPAPARPAPPPPRPAPVITGPVEVSLETPDGAVTIDLRDPVDDIWADEAISTALTELLEQAVANEPRIVRFGSDLFPEEAIERFSKGDYRRIKEYLDEPETGGFASDRDIMADVFNRRADYPDYERLRFSVNYRMLKEKKDFEFVGIDSDRHWISAGSSPVTPPARKPAEIGQDYRYLEDPAVQEVETEMLPEETGALSYSLSSFEYEQGVLPYDLRFKRLFPGPLFEDQRSALVSFEVPQLYVALIAEVRYPTGNRGGFIMGLRDLFQEHMVPGARFTITPTDRGEDVYEIHFNRADEHEENILQLDERRSRYVFRPVSFTIETDPDLLLTQEKFGKLQGRKKLEDSERRRPDLVVVNAFEAVGEENDGKFWAVLDDLFAVANIDRPISKSWLQLVLSGAYPFLYADPTTEGAYFYDPAKRQG